MTDPRLRARANAAASAAAALAAQALPVQPPTLPPLPGLVLDRPLASHPSASAPPTQLLTPDKVLKMEQSYDCDERYLKSLYQWRYIKWFSDDSRKINGLDWLPTGDRLVSSSDDGFIRIYNLNGEELTMIPSKKHGCVHVQWMPDGHSAVHGSNYEYSQDLNHHKIRHLDVANKQFVHYYGGHQQQVTSIDMNNHLNCFLSSSSDQTIRLWDCRLNARLPPGDRQSLGVINTRVQRPFAAFDPLGVVIGVGMNNDSIRLYDIRNYSKGPFKLNKFERKEVGEDGDWHRLTFSPDGRKLAIATNGLKIRVIDAFSLDTIKTLSSHRNDLKLPLQLTWTNDSRFIITGSSVSFLSSTSRSGEPFLYMYDITEKEVADQLTKLPTDHSAPVTCVKFNPKYYFLASACHDVAIWQPDQDFE